MKYIVYYDEGKYGRSPETKHGKEFKKNILEVLGEDAKIIWISSDHTHIETMVS